MVDYVYQWSLSTIRIIIKYIFFISIFSTLSCLCLYNNESDKISLETLLKFQSTATTTKRLIRIIYFREFDRTIDEYRLKNEVKNFTETYDIDLKLTIIDQSTNFLMIELCSLLGEEKRDTILIADLYTKEIDLISRSLQIPTIVTTNRYSIVQGKLHNPYLFKLMPDPIEQAESVAYTLETRSVYTRIALLYDNSLDMTEYRFSYLRLAKQNIIYRAHIPRISILYDLHNQTRKIISDLMGLNIDLILCIMSTERELQFTRFIKELGTVAESNTLLNKTSWWFASRLGEIRNLPYFPKIYTANADRRNLLSHFSVTVTKLLLNAILKTYIRLPVSSLYIGTTNCSVQQNIYQLEKTHLFIKLFTNYTEWSCDLRVGSGIHPILFDAKSLTWRLPTIFMVHTEHSCQGWLTRIFIDNNADPFLRACHSINSSIRKNSSITQQDNSTILTSSSNIKNYHQLIGKLTSNETTQCKYVHLDILTQRTIIVGVVEPPYIFVSEAEISSDFHCTYGLPCYQIDPLTTNSTKDPLFFHSKMTKPQHCCYGISVNLLLRIEDSKLVMALKTMDLFVFSDKPKKWLALVETLENRRAHLSISAIPYESFLARSIDLSPPFYHSSYVILTVPAPTGPSLGAFLQPFSWTTWCMIFVLLNTIALFETFFEWHSPYGLTPKGRRRHRVFSLASALTLSWSIIFSHTFKTKSPKCWSNRFLGNVWGGFGIVFISIYTAKLASFMVEMNRKHTASDIQGIVEECLHTPRCTIGVVPNSTDEEYLKRFHSSTLYRRIQYVPSYSQGIDLLSSYVITYLLMDHSMARYYLTRDVFKLIRISNDQFGRFGLSLGFSKFDNDLKNNITNILLSYVDKGIIQHLHDELYIYENCQRNFVDENRKLSVDRFFGVFMLLIGGIVLGIIVLLFEWFIFKYAVPYWRKRQWTGCLFCSQRLFAILNVSQHVYNKVYYPSKTSSFRSVGERLHNYSTRRDSLDLHVINVPKLLNTSYQLKEQMKNLHEQNREDIFLSPNGDLRSKTDNYEEKQIIRTRIYELEYELNQLKSQITTNSI